MNFQQCPQTLQSQQYGCAVRHSAGELHATFAESSPSGSHALPPIAPPVAAPVAQPAAWHGEYRQHKRPAQDQGTTHRPAMKQPPPTPTSPHQQADKPPHNQHILSIWGCAQVVDGLFMRLLSRPNGSWALQLAALTPRCAAKPYWWQYGQAAHTAIHRVNAHIKGRTFPPMRLGLYASC